MFISVKKTDNVIRHLTQCSDFFQKIACKWILPFAISLVFSNKETNQLRGDLNEEVKLLHNEALYNKETSPLIYISIIGTCVIKELNEKVPIHNFLARLNWLSRNFFWIHFLRISDNIFYKWFKTQHELKTAPFITYQAFILFRYIHTPEMS